TLLSDSVFVRLEIRGRGASRHFPSVALPEQQKIFKINVVDIARFDQERVWNKATRKTIDIEKQSDRKGSSFSFYNINYLAKSVSYWLLFRPFRDYEIRATRDSTPRSPLETGSTRKEGIVRITLLSLLLFFSFLFSCELRGIVAEIPRDSASSRGCRLAGP
ncbi:hypothetical protein ANANG_G00042790, partial [Anguilla anguilla]